MKMRRWSGECKRDFLIGLVLSFILHATQVQGDLSLETAGSLITHVIDYQTVAHLDALGQISDADGSLERTFLSPAHRRAAIQISQWMAEAGMTTWVDVIGNVHGRVNGTRPDNPAILMGSHYDTVRDAGKYDGTLGIIVSIAAVKALLMRQAILMGAAKQLQISPATGEIVISSDLAERLVTRPLHVVAFCDEEGVRFGSTFLGSRALAGTLIKHNMLSATDRRTGETLSAILSNEYKGSEDFDSLGKVAALAMPAEQIGQYIEVHMEQGPVLHERNLSLGVVSAIAGQSRLKLKIVGRQGHAGTVPMASRADALTAAASVVGMIERRCGGGPPSDGDERPADVIETGEGEMLVCTVGELSVWPGASNVIPGGAELSIDVRCKSDTLRGETVANIVAGIEELCVRRGVQCDVVRTHDAEATLCDPEITEGLAKAIREAQAEALAPPKPASGAPADTCKSSRCGKPPQLPPGVAQEDSDGSDGTAAAAAAVGTCGSVTKTVGRTVGGTADGTTTGQCTGPAGKAAGGGGDGDGVSDEEEEDDEDYELMGGGKVPATAAAGGSSGSTAAALDEVPAMVSGAGHDAMAIAEVAKIGMIFVRCGNGGISHSPLETVAPADTAAAAAALSMYLRHQISV